MSHIKRQYESYPANYYSVDADPGNRRRTQQVPANYIEQQRFYGTTPGQILQKRNRNAEQNMEQFDNYSEGYYEDPDAEAHVIYNTRMPAEYIPERQNVPPRNYYTASPQVYGRNAKGVSQPRNQSPYVMAGNMRFNLPPETQEVSESHKGPKYYSRQHIRGDPSEFDEREAQLFSSMSQAELKDHVIQNANTDDYDNKDEAEIIIEQFKQYLNLVQEVKKSDYIRGFNTSVSYAQLKELENIKDRFDGESSGTSVLDSDLHTSVKTATQEIEEVLTQNGNSYSINDIIKYVKKQFYKVFLNYKPETELALNTPAPDLASLVKFKDTEGLEDVRGRLDFQNAMDDLTKHYEWLKEKSFKSLENLEEKYNQALDDLNDLSKRISSYSIMEGSSSKGFKSTGQRIPQLKDTDKTIIFNVLEDVLGLVGYTTDAVTVAVENSYEDIDILKGSINEYNELLEDKIKKLPTIISSSNLKTATKHNKNNDLYDIYCTDPEKSDRSDLERKETKLESELKKDVRKLKDQVNQWKKDHKELFDTVNENKKLLARMMKNKGSGPDSVATMKELYSASNQKISDILKAQYNLHYNKNKKPKSKRDVTERVQKISPTRENKSQAMLPTNTQEEEPINEDLVNRINSLREEIKELRNHKVKADAKVEENEHYRTKFESLLKEHRKLKQDIEKLETDKYAIEDLTKDNTKLNERINNLKSENKSLESMLDENKGAGAQNLKEFREILSRAKKSCESQIENAEESYERSIRDLSRKLDEKDKKLTKLETKLDDFKTNIMPQVRREAEQKISQKLTEIQTLNSRNKDLKSTIDKITNDKETTETKLRKTQDAVADLKEKLHQSEEEQERLQKEADEQRQLAEEQEAIASSLYEERLKEKNREIDELTQSIEAKTAEIEHLREDMLQVDTKLTRFEDKTKGVQSLLTKYSDKFYKINKSGDPSIKLALDELNSLLDKREGEEDSAVLKLNQMTELLKEKDELEGKVTQLEWDYKEEKYRTRDLQKSLDDFKQRYKEDIETKDFHYKNKEKEIERLQDELQTMFNKAIHKDQEMAKITDEKSDEQEAHEKTKAQKRDLEAVIEQYRFMANKLCTIYDYECDLTKEERDNSNSVLDDLLERIKHQKQNLEQKLKDNEKALEELQNKQVTEYQNQKDDEIEELKQTVNSKEEQLKKLADEVEELKQFKENQEKQKEGEGEKDEEQDTTKEKEKLEDLIEEKNEIISNHVKTLENMRSTILKLRDNLQTAFDDNETKNEEIEQYKEQMERMEKAHEEQLNEQKVSLLLTINSHFIKAGHSAPKDKLYSDMDPPTLDELYEIIIGKIQGLPEIDHKDEVDDTTNETMKLLEDKNKELTNQLKDFKETLDKKEKDFKLISKQRDTLRSQLGSAVEMMNSKEPDGSPQKGTDSDILPSLQSQLQFLQDESKQSEATRDITENLIESFERNDRKMRDMLDKANSKMKGYKARLKEQKALIKQLQFGDTNAKETVDLRNKLSTEIKKKIREEEISKRDKEIERQRKLMSSKSEEQSIQFNQKIEELEAKLEAKDDEVTDLLIQIQEANREVEKLKQSKDKNSRLSIEDQLNDLTDEPSKTTKSNKYDNQMKILEKVEKLDEKIIELGEKIGNYRTELIDRIEDEIEEINNQSTASKITKLGEKALEKLQKMKDTNMVVQVVRKIETEGFTWLLLEKKDPLDKPLEIKTSHSLSKSSIGQEPGGRKLFWICEEGLKEELLEYVYSYTPSFLLNSNNLKLTIPDLFQDDSERKAWQTLKDTTKELMQKRQELLKEQREIKLGLRRDNFLLEEAMTVETEERLRELENKNIEFEDEIQSLTEENNSLNIKNKELLVVINALNTRLKEINNLVYDFSRDKPNEEVLKTNADLIRQIDQVKSDKMMVEQDLKKLKEALEKHNIRPSRPEGKNIEYPNSPTSFVFDGEDNEIFGESFIIDSSNKELEEKIKNLEEELRAAQSTIQQKNETIVELETKLEEMEQEQKVPNEPKSSSFEMMNNDNIKHIKEVLIKFLKNMPRSSKDNEMLLDIVFSMLHMQESEIKEIRLARQKITPPDPPAKKKSGLFGRMMK